MFQKRCLLTRIDDLTPVFIRKADLSHDQAVEFEGVFIHLRQCLQQAAKSCEARCYLNGIPSSGTVDCGIDRITTSSLVNGKENGIIQPGHCDDIPFGFPVALSVGDQAFVGITMRAKARLKVIEALRFCIVRR
ncbi:hypothetical protein ALP29_201247 [Pseudomonas syringae pv. avii]|uniref:Uncharacterized protein n=1 Tax=Pseudomonas syringae pv. avii TaxID=663959 RepID=A0A3M5WBU0_PSESX|nr:hypothetical protein ALP29_201247 [Pseudomonas syringae pv. avii]